MCNACGFECCAMDYFEGCGCEGCHEPKCWDYDDGFQEGEDDYLDEEEE
jgi:hypothetical protein